MIELKQVDKVYQTAKIETTALQHIDLRIDAGDFVSVMGPSGCGKSTLLNLIGLLDLPTKGEIRLRGQSMKGYGDRQLAKFRNRHVGFVFQSFHLIADLTVADNVEIPLLYRGLSGSKRRSMALAALERVGLSSRVHHFPNQLSGGQQQRVAIARAVVGTPSILLADEPTGNLDSHMGEEIMNILKTLNGESGTTVVMVTHDEEKAAQTNRVIRGFDGRLVA